jgi:tetratricopeptide (TPR) repeat protein
LTGVGWLAEWQGDKDQAQTYYEEGLALARTSARGEVLSWILTLRGWLAYTQKDLRQAEVYAQEGVALARRLEHQDAICYMVTLLGRLAEQRGDDQQAEVFYDEGIALVPHLKRRPLAPPNQGHLQMLSHLLFWAGEMHLKRGKREAATAAFHTLLDLIPEGPEDLLPRVCVQYGPGQVEVLSWLLSLRRWLTSTSKDSHEAEMHVQAGLVLAHRMEHLQTRYLLEIDPLRLKRHLLVLSIVFDNVT